MSIDNYMSWYADILNYIMSGVSPLELKPRQRKNFMKQA